MDDRTAAAVGLCYLVLCLLLMALWLQLNLSQRRIPRTVFGLLLTAFTLITHPYIYASRTQVFSPVLAFLCSQLALTLLHWSFVEPLDRKPAVLEVLASHIQHSLHGVRKIYQRTLRKQQQQHEAVQQQTQQQQQQQGQENRKQQQQQQQQQKGGKVSSKEPPAGPTEAPAPAPAAAAADARLSQPRHVPDAAAWAISVLKAVTAVLTVSIDYDVTFYLLCSLTSFCNPANVGKPMMQGVRQAAAAAAAGGVWQQFGAASVAYLKLCIPGMFAVLVMGIQLNLVYCWVVLGLHVAAFALPRLRTYCSSLPLSAFNRPWVTVNLRELWGKRWQQFLRFYFDNLGPNAADTILDTLPRGVAAPAILRHAVHAASAFFLSALTHEYTTWASYGILSGFYLLFFGAQYMLVLTETAFASTLGRRLPDFLAGHSKFLSRCWTWGVCTLTVPLFFEPFRVSPFYSQCAFHPFGVSLASTAVSWLTAAKQ